MTWGKARHLFARRKSTVKTFDDCETRKFWRECAAISRCLGILPIEAPHGLLLGHFCLFQTEALVAR